MNKSILQNGDLLFMSDESEFSNAIIETTEKYSHVGIYFDDMLYHASRYWKKYYEELGVPVPVGKPGTNPGQLAKYEKLHYIGKLDY